MSGKVPRERMVQLRRESKLRERLQSHVNEAEEQIYSTQYSIDYYRQQLTGAMTYETQADERDRARASFETEISRLERQMVSLRQKLDIAVHELEDFEDATREASQRDQTS